MPPLLPLTNLLHRRPRHRIRIKRPKHIKRNPRIPRFIKARGRHTPRQRLRPTALDLDIDALGIRLRAIRLPRGVQRNDLVAHDVVARREVGDRQVPREIVLD